MNRRTNDARFHVFDARDSILPTLTAGVAAYGGLLLCISGNRTLSTMNPFGLVLVDTGVQAQTTALARDGKRLHDGSLPVIAADKACDGAALSALD